MLNVYAAEWCPHCRNTIAYLKEKAIPFEYHDVDAMDAETERKLIEVNGGEDWVVPTLEHDGRWRPGKAFDRDELEADLKKLGVTA